MRYYIVRQKGFFLLPIIVIVLLVGVSGYFIYQNIKLQKGNEIPITPSIVPTADLLKPSPTTDPTENWKTFKIKDFNFKYPFNWQLDTGGKKISSSAPEVVLWSFSSGDPMYNECMKLDDSQVEGDLTIKTFSRVVTIEACKGGDTNLMEKWIVKTDGEGYAPGIQYIYKSTQKTTAETAFNQILSTFKFTN